MNKIELLKQLDHLSSRIDETSGEQLASILAAEVNHDAELANQLTRWLMKLADMALKMLAESQFPFLATPVIRQIFEFIVGTLMQKLSVLIQEDVTVLILNFQTEAEKKAFNAAMEKLKKFPIGGDPNELNEALKKAKAAMDALGHWDGISVPK